MNLHPAKTQISLGAQPFCWFCHVTAHIIGFADNTEADFINGIEMELQQMYTLTKLYHVTLLCTPPAEQHLPVYAMVNVKALWVLENYKIS